MECNMNAARDTSNDNFLSSISSFGNITHLRTLPKRPDFIPFVDKKFETVFEMSADGIWLCNGQGRVIMINRASEKLMGLKRSEVVGKKVADIAGQGLLDAYLTDEVIRTGRKMSQIQTARLTGRKILCTGTPVLDADGEVSMVIVNERDLSGIIECQMGLDDIRCKTTPDKDELAAVVIQELADNNIVAESAKTRTVMRNAVRFGQMNVSEILILGESGTGKGMTAKFIHACSPRSAAPFVQINCAAIPEHILEAELFGYEKGAFTGAKVNGKPGLIEVAQGGTLFLDEIGELPPPGQAKLLKYLDDHEVMRIGGTRSVKINCKVIAATNQDLERLVDEGKFRADLLFRLNSLSIKLPPLRERPEDIFQLAYQFLKSGNEKYHVNKRINPFSVAMLQTYSFPGNIRELKNIIKKGIIMSESRAIDHVVMECIGQTLEDDVTGAIDREGNIRNLEEITAAFEKVIIKDALKKCHSTRELARYVNSSQPTIVRKLKKHGLSTRPA